MTLISPSLSISAILTSVNRSIPCWRSLPVSSSSDRCSRRGLRAHEAPVPHQHDRGRCREPGDRRRMEAGPVDQPVPAEDRADEDRPLGDSRIAAGHGVLRGVRQQDQQQQIRDAERAGVDDA